MSSRRRTSWTRSAEDGFTLAEVMAALALLSALGVVAAAGFVSGDRGLRRVSDEARRNAELLRLDRVVRAHAQRVLMPYWLGAPRAAAAPGALSIFYLDGAEETALRIWFEDGVLTVGNGIENVRFDGVRDAKMEIAAARERGPAVLRLTVRLAGLEPVTILAALGGRPFPSEASP